MGKRKGDGDVIRETWGQGKYFSNLRIRSKRKGWAETEETRMNEATGGNTVSDYLVQLRKANEG
jgi:hypothetical protein